MNLRHIEIFHAVYIHGSVSGAARALNVSQPSVTKMLRHAESLLGLSLFDRVRGRLLPTADAHALFAEVSEIQDRVYALRQSGQNLRFGRGGMLRVAALPSLGLDLLPRAIAAFHRQHPETGFDIHTTHHDEMVRRLYERDADLVLGYEVPPNSPVASESLGRGELVALYPQSYALPDTPRIALPDLVPYPFISTLQSGPIGRVLQAEMGRQSVQFDEVISARTFYTAAALAGEGVGFTIVDSFTAAAQSGDTVVHRRLAPPLSYDVHAIYLEARPPSKIMWAFLDIVKQLIADDKL